jgi:hypothetical protein
MPKRSDSGESVRRQLAEFRAVQEEMLNLSREYGRERLSVWAEEVRSLKESWDNFSQEWQGSFADLTSLAINKFGEISAQGEAAAGLISESWDRTLTGLSAQVDDWGEHFLQTLQKVASAWMGSIGGGSGGGWAGLLGEVWNFGGLFHQGGMVTAHQGMVVAPETLLGDEQLILAQAGEGILPRDSMSRLGEANFEALRRGAFEVTPGGGAPRYDINIQVQSLDAAGVAGLDWDRLVQRHLLPLLQKETDRRW